MALVVATHNTHKVQEIEERLGHVRIDVKPLPDGLPDAPEDGDTFRANAEQKALFYSKYVTDYVLSDDSGLTVPALGGEPGVLSARYAGRHGDDKANNEKLIARLLSLGQTEAFASFVCAMTVCKEGQILFTVEGKVDGTVSAQMRGTNGFGYDPLFAPAGSSARFAEMAMAEKAQFSHRARALSMVVEKWRETVG